MYVGKGNGAEHMKTTHEKITLKKKLWIWMSVLCVAVERVVFILLMIEIIAMYSSSYCLSDFIIKPLRFH